MVDKVEAAVVGVLDVKGRIKGTGFLAGEGDGAGLILTCAHVVETAGGPPLAVRFQQNGETRRAALAADGWLPEEDVAVLQLDGSPPDGVAPLPLGTAAGCEGHEFRSFGYPRLGDFAGVPARGTIDGFATREDGRRALQLVSENLDKGHSGAPVWDERGERVIGMVKEVFYPDETLRHYRNAYAAPAERLWRAYPALKPAAAGENPFFAGGRINDPAGFFGRERLLREIRAELAKRVCISLVGESQVGKSSLLYYLRQTRRQWAPGTPVAYVDLQGVWDEDDFCRTILGKIEGGAETPPTPHALKRALTGRDVILLLDEVERMAWDDFDPRWQNLFRSLAQQPGFALCIAAQRPLEVIFAGDAGGVSEFYNIFTTKRLGPFTERESRAFLRARLAGSGVAFTPAEIERLVAESGGHPARLQRLAKALFARYARRRRS